LALYVAEICADALAVASPKSFVVYTEVLREKYTSLFIVFFEPFYDLRKKWIRFEMTEFEFVIWLSEEDSVNIVCLLHKSSNQHPLSLISDEGKFTGEWLSKCVTFKSSNPCTGVPRS